MIRIGGALFLIAKEHGSRSMQMISSTVQLCSRSQTLITLLRCRQVHTQLGRTMKVSAGIRFERQVLISFYMPGSFLL